MFARLLVTIAAIAVVTAALLSLRQHRLSLLHAMGELHVQMDADRKQTWAAQTAIAEGTHPIALREAFDRVAPQLTPDAPVRPAAAEPRP